MSNVPDDADDLPEFALWAVQDFDPLHINELNSSVLAAAFLLIAWVFTRIENYPRIFLKSPVLLFFRTDIVLNSFKKIDEGSCFLPVESLQRLCLVFDGCRVNFLERLLARLR